MRSEDGAPRLPKFDYYLDESDPDVVVLRRQDGAFVAAFSARGATMEGIVEAGKEDYAALLRENAGALGLAAEEQHQEQPESARPSNAAYSPNLLEGLSRNFALTAFSEPRRT